MTKPHVIPFPALEVSGEIEPARERLSAPPILITEQEVAFSTAAAVGVVQIADGYHRVCASYHADDENTDIRAESPDTNHQCPTCRDVAVRLGVCWPRLDMIAHTTSTTSKLQPER
jgi:hypothetical protein